MLNITFIQPDGSRREIEAMPHESAMEAAMRHDVGGIVAECGGSCMCATCHVYLDAAFLGIAGAPAKWSRACWKWRRLSCGPKAGWPVS